MCKNFARLCPRTVPAFSSVPIGRTRLRRSSLNENFSPGTQPRFTESEPERYCDYRMPRILFDIYRGPQKKGDDQMVYAPTAEGNLILRAQQGDHEAFAALYKNHWRRVYAVCLRITREQQEAEDCAQEAFMQCFLRLSTFRGESALSTWLYRLSVNVVLMRLRSKRGRTVALDEESGHDITPGAASLNSMPVRDLYLAGAVDRIALQRALRKLPIGYRTIFVLHDMEGLAHSEIARRLGCSIGNSKSQLHQARVCLRRFLRRPSKQNRQGRPWKPAAAALFSRA